MTALALPTPPPCIACGRRGTRTELRIVAPDEVLPLCLDPVSCRHHWPVQGRAGVRV
jgi:hypothetical protein